MVRGTPHILLAVTLGAGVGFSSHLALAQPTETREAYVVGLDSGDLLIDVSESDGVKPGAVVEIWRPVVLKHPVTGMALRDRFRIGRLRIHQALDALSLASPVGKLSRPAAVGDVILVEVARSAAPTPQTAPRDVTAELDVVASRPSLDPETAALSELVEQLRGQTLGARVAAYEAFAQEHPNGRFNQTLLEEAAQLRRLIAIGAQPSTTESLDVENFDSPRHVLAGTELRLALEIGGKAEGAVLHSRNPGEVSYQTTPMRPAGPGFFSIVVPAERVETPWLEFFVEAVPESGEAAPVLGTATSPKRIRVEAIPEPTAPPHFPVQAAVITDYADWNNFEGNDVVWQTEGFVGVRLDDVGLRAVRTGFGVLRGVGGSLDELDRQGLSARSVGLTYGYVEGEFGVSHFTGLIGRAVVGLGDDGVAGGAQFLLRLGNDQETNLLLGGEVLGSVGLRSITQLELTTLERFPVLFRIEVTNQPAGIDATGDVRPARPDAALDETSLSRGEVGARAIGQLGYEVVSDLVVSGRLSYQGRTINHAGPGFGGGVAYQW